MSQSLASLIAEAFVSCLPEPVLVLLPFLFHADLYTFFFCIDLYSSYFGIMSTNDLMIEFNGPLPTSYCTYLTNTGASPECLRNPHEARFIGHESKLIIACMCFIVMASLLSIMMFIFYGFKFMMLSILRLFAEIYGAIFYLCCSCVCGQDSICYCSDHSDKDYWNRLKGHLFYHFFSFLIDKNDKKWDAVRNYTKHANLENYEYQSQYSIWIGPFNLFLSGVASALAIAAIGLVIADGSIYYTSFEVTCYLDFLSCKRLSTGLCTDHTLPFSVWFLMISQVFWAIRMIIARCLGDDAFMATWLSNYMQKRKMKNSQETQAHADSNNQSTEMTTNVMHGSC
jgi:hypothetical protein